MVYRPPLLYYLIYILIWEHKNNFDQIKANDKLKTVFMLDFFPLKLTLEAASSLEFFHILMNCFNKVKEYSGKD